MIFNRRNKRQAVRAQDEADAALKTSINDLHAAVIDGREVAEVAHRLRRIQHRNHFSENIRRAYGRPA